ncbi:hypothetical protein D3C76_1491420 [compost metagenome]
MSLVSAPTSRGLRLVPVAGLVLVRLAVGPLTPSRIASPSASSTSMMLIFLRKVLECWIAVSSFCAGVGATVKVTVAESTSLIFACWPR